MSELQVYKAIANVSAKLAQSGISKDRNNQAQGYKFRGIDDVYNALAPIIAAEKLCILPTVTERLVVERVNAKGTALFYVTVKVDFAFVSAEDGSRHVVTTYGEAMDSGDKATNKAMSAAYKYAAMQAFCIPTEGDNDADSHTHEVRAANQPRGISDGALADWLAATETAETPEALRAVWSKAAEACRAADDTAAYAKIKDAVTKRGAVLKAAA